MQDLAIGRFSLGLESSAVTVVPFIDDVADAMAGAHLVISRAGALATAELAAAGRPSLLVPLLAAGGGHQRFNAERMAAAGAALALSGDELGVVGVVFDKKHSHL